MILGATLAIVAVSNFDVRPIPRILTWVDGRPPKGRMPMMVRCINSDMNDVCFAICHDQHAMNSRNARFNGGGVFIWQIA